MEHAEGGDLETRIKKHRPMSEKEIVTLFTHVCLGLRYMHKAGKIHRDLKASNVLIKGECPWMGKLADFGLVKDKSEVDGPGIRAGTTSIMAPESLFDDYDEKVDIWALGILLF